jgi:hypothetical protein
LDITFKTLKVEDHVVNVTNVHVCKNLEKLQYRRGLGRIGFTRISWCICAGDAFPDTDRSQPLPLALQAHHSPELLDIYSISCSFLNKIKN